MKFETANLSAGLYSPQSEMRPFSRAVFVTMISIVAALGGFLFGFDTAVISGALNSMILYFGIQNDSILQGWLVSSIVLGCAIGAIVSGYLADTFGRKYTLILTAILFLSSAVGCTIASSLFGFISARCVAGLAVGIAGMVAPLYISEVSPPKIRGRLVCIYQLAIAIGVLSAYLSNDLIRIVHQNPDRYRGISKILFLNDSEIWRTMLASEIIPSLLFMILVPFIPKSPRFMIMRNNLSDAWQMLVKTHGESVAREEFDQIQESLASNKGNFKQLFLPGLRRATFIAVFLAVAASLSGIDIVLHYGPLILERAGLSFSHSLSGQIVFGFVLVIFTLLAIWKVDVIGRRRLLVIGNIGIFLSLVMIGLCFYFDGANEFVLIFWISVFVASFSFSLGPIPWIIMSEIFPIRLRGRAMAMTTFIMFAANFLVTQMFPVMNELVGGHITFWILAALSLPTFIFVWKVLPETKGQSLEEIDRLWMKENKT